METLYNDYFRIEPLQHDQFVVSDKVSYEEMGTIVNMPQYYKDNYPGMMGGICFFDSYIAKKYPVIGGKPGEYQWFVPFSEIVKIELSDAP